MNLNLTTTLRILSLIILFSSFPSENINAQLAQSKRLLGHGMTPDSNYILKYETAVWNSGSTPLCDVVIEDDLTSNYASCNVVSTEVINVYGRGGLSVWDYSSTAGVWDGGVDWDNNGTQTTFSLNSNPDSLCQVINCGTLCLAPGEGVHIWFIVKIDDECFNPDGTDDTYDNQATSTGTVGNGGTTLNEISGDGSNPTSVAQDPTPATIGYDQALIGAARTITDTLGNIIDIPPVNSDGTYDFSYHYTICNHDWEPNGGANTIEDVAIWTSVTHLPNWQTIVNSLEVLNPTGPLIPNLNYDGDWDSEANILAQDGGDLFPGQCDTIELRLNVGPIEEDDLNNFFYWNGTASGWDGSETIVDMIHDDRGDIPYEPDPTTCGPQDDCEASRIKFEAAPDIELQKEVVGIFLPVSGTLGNVDVEWKFTVTNTGNVALDELSLLDSIQSNWGAACVVGVASDSTKVVNIDSSVPPSENTGFTGADSGPLGTADLLSGSSTDYVDLTQVFEVYFRVEVSVDDCPNPLINPASVYGTAPNGRIVSDTSVAQVDLPELGSIGDNIINDLTTDPIQGVMVVLYDDSGNPLDTAYTDALGNYLFDGLPPGDYTVTVDPTNFESGGPLDGMANTTDPDGGFDNTSNISLAEGEDNLDQDFAYTPLGSIGDTIINDDTGDPIAGVMVVLYDDTGAPIDTAYTDASGNYLFSDVPAGDYTVTVDPTNFDAGGPLDGLSNSTDPDGGLDNTSDVTLTAGEDNLDQDFAYVQLGSIGDNIINDDSGNPIAGVMVVLYDDTGAPIDTAYTDASGNYLFSDVPAGDYTVTVDPTNFDAGGPLDGLSNSTDPDGGLDNTSDVTLAAGEDNLDQDFAYMELGSIGDNIINDDTGNPIAGVMVVLYDDTGAPIDTAYTDATGNYLFSDVPAGDYTVMVDPTNFDAGGPLDGLSNSTDPDGGLDNTSDVTLAAGEDNLDQDFGYNELGSIGDNIVNDDTGNPIQGVMVVLYDDNGAPIDTAYTDASGNYLFSDIPAGDYSVTVDPSNFDPSGPLDGMINSTDPDGGLDNTSDVTLTAGEDNLDQDFGYEEAGGIGDTVLNDDTSDPIENVMVVLLDDLGNPIDTAYTNSSGMYYFGDLPAGTYNILVDPTNFDSGGPLFGLNISTDPDGGGDHTSEITITSGEENLDQDFGYQSNLLAADIFNFQMIKDDINCLANLVWNTNPNTKVGFYTIEYSNDGSTWSSLSKTPFSQGNSVQKYSININQPEDLAYLRITEQFDNSNIEVVKIIAVKNTCQTDNYHLKVFPNPSSSNFNLSINRNQIDPIKLTIFKIGGEKIYELKLLDQHASTFPIIPPKKLATGVYILVLYGQDGKNYHTKLIVN